MTLRLNNSFKKQGAIQCLRWLFLEEEKEADNRHLMRWSMSSDRRKMLRNEKGIAEIPEKAEARTVTI